MLPVLYGRDKELPEKPPFRNAVDNSKANPPQQLNQKSVSGSALSDIVNVAIGKGKSAVLVFTYDADCCSSTKEYFEKHRIVVKGLEQKYSAVVNFIWIDVACYSETEKDRAFMRVHDEYSVHLCRLALHHSGYGGSTGIRRHQGKPGVRVLVAVPVLHWQKHPVAAGGNFHRTVEEHSGDRKLKISGIVLIVLGLWFLWSNA